GQGAKAVSDDADLDSAENGVRLGQQTSRGQSRGGQFCEISSCESHFISFSRASLPSLEFHFPAFAIGGLDPLGGVLVVAELALAVVPHQLAFVVNGSGAEHQPLGVRSGDGEIGAGGRAAFAGTDPVVGMRRVVGAGAGAGRTLQVRVGQLVFGPTGSGEQSDAFAASAGTEVAFGADEDAVVAAALAAARSTAATTAGTGRTGSAGSTGSTAAARRHATGAHDKAALPGRGSDLWALAGDLAGFFGSHARRCVGVAARVVIPVNGHGRHAAGALGKLVLEGQFVGEGKGRQRIFLDALVAEQVLGIQLERPVRRSEDVHAPVADQAAAEIVKATPVEGQVEAEILLAAKAAAASAGRTRSARRAGGARSARRWGARACRAATAASTARIALLNKRLVGVITRGKRPGRGAAEPEIPIEGVGNGCRRRDGHHLLRPTGTAGPGMDLFNLADLSRPEDLAGDARGIVRVALVAHLGGDFVFFGRRREEAGLPREAGQRLLHVHVLAMLHAGPGADGVHVVGRANHHGVNVFALFVEHLAEVL